MVEVLQAAENLRVKREGRQMEQLGILIQNAVVKAFSQK